MSKPITDEQKATANEILRHLFPFDFVSCRDYDEDRTWLAALLAEREAGAVSDALAGDRAAKRSQWRRKLLSIRANLMCPCGQILQCEQELDAHLDHYIEAAADDSCGG